MYLTPKQTDWRAGVFPLRRMSPTGVGLQRIATSAARGARDGSPSESRGNGPAPSFFNAELSA